MKTNWWITVAILISTQCLLDYPGVNAAFYDDESSLRTAVLNGYEYKIRPASTVSVTVTLSLLNINVLDVPSQRLSVSGWLVFQWHDPRLTWTPATYGGIEDIYDTELVLWRPEVIVDNSVANLGIIESDKLLIRATYEGNMTWEPPGIYETHCDVDVTFYPFDTQVCVVEVTSWAYTLNEVDLEAQNSTINLADFEESGEWDILSTWSERTELIDGPNTHSELKFNLRLQRKPAYYITTIVIPVIVTAILCILVFLLPAETGEKVGYSLTILLTYTVMLTLVASYMPPTSKHTSVLSVYLTIILFVGVFSTIATVFVLYCHHQTEESKIPQWLIKMTNSFFVPVSCWKRAGSSSGIDNSATSPNGPPPLTHRFNKVNPDHKSNGRPESRARNSVGIGGQQHNNVRSDRPSNFDDDDHEGWNQKPNGLDNQSKDEATDFSWQEISIIIDKVCLRLLGTFVFLLTITCLLTMIIGGCA